MDEKKISFNFISKALGLKPVDPEPQVKPENNPMSPAFVSVDPFTGDKYTGD